jgi:hypothetical protein
MILDQIPRVYQQFLTTNDSSLKSDLNDWDLLQQESYVDF